MAPAGGAGGPFRTLASPQIGAGGDVGRCVTGPAGPETRRARFNRPPIGSIERASGTTGLVVSGRLAYHAAAVPATTTTTTPIAPLLTHRRRRAPRTGH